MGLNVAKIRADFPIFSKPINKKPVIYFDNACMTLKPRQVVEKINEYYYEYPACAGRSHHKLSKRATEEVFKSREQFRKFINAKKSEEIIFNKNTTEGINTIANSLKLLKGDVVITTDKEHNSNLVPWLVQQKKNGIKLEQVKSDAKNNFDISVFQDMMSKNVKLVSMVHTANLDGSTTPLKEITKIAHDFGAQVLVDGAQSIPHKEIDVKKLDIDFMAFSVHKMCGPTGLGVLYGKSAALEALEPFIVGGDTVIDTTYTDVQFEKPPEKFEAGLQHYAGIVGGGEACRYLEKIGRDNIEKHELMLNKMITDEMNNIFGMKLLGPEDPKLRSGIVSFNYKDTDPHEIALLMDQLSNVMIRSGAHCVHSWFNAHKLKGSARASLYMYNTPDEVKVFIETLKKVVKMV